MNNRGFTLIELLAVVAIIAMVGLIAVPNMIGISDNVKKDNMIDDAKKLISIAKMKINMDYEARDSNSKKYYFNELNENKEISTDPDGGSYFETSYVEYQKNGGTVNYCIYLEGQERRIGTYDECVLETNLFSRNNVVSK